MCCTHLLLQFHGGDAVPQQAAALVVSLVHGHRVSRLGNGRESEQTRLAKFFISISEP